MESALKKQGLEAAFPVLRDNNVDEKKLKTMNADQLVALGLKLGLAKKVAKAFGSSEAASPASPQPSKSSSTTSANAGDVQQKLNQIREIQAKVVQLDAEASANARKEEVALHQKRKGMYKQIHDLVRTDVASIDQVFAEEDEEDEEEEDGESKPKKAIKGIPGFWRDVLVHTPDFSGSIFPQDEDVLLSLQDIRLVYAADLKSVSIEFEFLKNEYFTNNIVAKKLEWDKNGDVAKSVSSEIDWKDGQNVTITTKDKKQKAKGAKKAEVVSKVAYRKSFFHVFDDKNPEEDETMFYALRDIVLPNADLWYSGDDRVECFEEIEVDERLLPRLKQIQPIYEKIRGEKSNESSSGGRTDASKLYDERSKIIDGIDEFWPTVLKNCDDFFATMRRDDGEALKSLTRIDFNESSDEFSFTFHFKANGYFKNKSLKKTYKLNADGSLSKATGTKVDWTNDLTTRTKVKKGEDGEDVETIVKCGCFFDFFDPKDIASTKKSGVTKEQEEKIRDEIAEDFHLGQTLRDLVYPEPDVWFELDSPNEFDDEDHWGDSDSDSDDDGPAGPSSRSGKGKGGAPKLTATQLCKYGIIFIMVSAQLVYLLDRAGNPL